MSVALEATQDLRHGAALRRRHQTLMRAYQARYIVLPPAPASASIIADLDRRYDADALGQLESARRDLERALIAPRARAAIQACAGADFVAYAEALPSRLRAGGEDVLTAYLRTTPDREAHYRDFLVQSSSDLLAEASASAFGVIGAFGAPQSGLFRILIDEFGYGCHARKHSVLYQAVMRDFGLCDAYDAYAPLFDTASLELHNTIHWLFQNPRNVFLQAGFLLFAETAYQRTTADHFRYLREFHPQVDARYFGEHAHIDLHHTRMVVDEVATPFIASYGPEAGAEIVAGAELTRDAFARAGAHRLAVCRAFADAITAGIAVYSRPEAPAAGAMQVTPADAHRLDSTTRIQIGGLGFVTAAAFAAFPDRASGLLVEGPVA